MGVCSQLWPVRWLMSVGWLSLVLSLIHNGDFNMLKEKGDHVINQSERRARKAFEVPRQLLTKMQRTHLWNEVVRWRNEFLWQKQCWRTRLQINYVKSQRGEGWSGDENLNLERVTWIHPRAVLSQETLWITFIIFLYSNYNSFCSTSEWTTIKTQLCFELKRILRSRHLYRLQIRNNQRNEKQN